MARKRIVGPGELDRGAFVEAMLAAISDLTAEAPRTWSDRCMATAAWSLRSPGVAPPTFASKDLDDALAAALAASSLLEVEEGRRADDWIDSASRGFLRSTNALHEGEWQSRLLAAETASRTLMALAGAGVESRDLASAFRRGVGGALPLVGWGLGGLAAATPDSAASELRNALTLWPGTEWISPRLPASSNPEAIAGYVLSMGEPWLLGQPEPRAAFASDVNFMALAAAGEAVGEALGGTTGRILPMIDDALSPSGALSPRWEGSHYYPLKVMVSALPWSGMNPGDASEVAARILRAATANYRRKIDSGSSNWVSWLMNDCLRVLGGAGEGAAAESATRLLVETLRGGSQGKYTLLLENLVAAAVALRSVGGADPEAAAKAVRLPALVISLDERVTGDDSASLGGGPGVALGGAAEFCITLAEFDRDSASDVLVVLRDAVERALSKVRREVPRRTVWPFFIGGKGMAGWLPGQEPNWETGAVPSPQTILSKFVEACAAVGGHEGARSLVRIVRRLRPFGVESSCDALCRVILPGARALLEGYEQPALRAAESRWTAWPGRA